MPPLILQRAAQEDSWKILTMTTSVLHDAESVNLENPGWFGRRRLTDSGAVLALSSLPLFAAHLRRVRDMAAVVLYPEHVAAVPR